MDSSAKVINGCQLLIILAKRSRLTIFTGKNCFTQFKNGCLVASDLFHMFTEAIKLGTFYYDVLKSTDVWKMWFIRYSKNKWLLLSASSTANFELVFCLNTRKRFFLEVLNFNSNRKSIFFKKTVLGITLRLRDRHVVMWQLVEILNNFNTLNLKQNFWKVKTFLKELEYSFLVESTKIENASSP